jgi:hypothetical protein
MVEDWFDAIFERDDVEVDEQGEREAGDLQVAAS